MANDIRNGQQGEIILYQPNDDIKLEVKLEDDTVWLTQQQMTELFQTSKQNVSLHINNIFREGELDRELVVKESLTTTKHGAMTGKVQQKRVLLYNLDVIISVGYRVKSQRGTQFRIWATKVLREYLLRGYTIHPQLQKVEYHLSRQISDQNDRIYALEQKIQNQQQQLISSSIFIAQIRRNCFLQVVCLMRGSIYLRWFEQQHIASHSLIIIVMNALC